MLGTYDAWNACFPIYFVPLFQLRYNHTWSTHNSVGTTTSPHVDRNAFHIGMKQLSTQGKR